MKNRSRANMVSPEGTWTAQEPAGTPFWISFGPHIGKIFDKSSKNSGISKSFQNSMQYTTYSIQHSIQHTTDSMQPTAYSVRRRHFNSHGDPPNLDGSSKSVPRTSKRFQKPPKTTFRVTDRREAIVDGIVEQTSERLAQTRGGGGRPPYGVFNKKTSSKASRKPQCHSFLLSFSLPALTLSLCLVPLLSLPSPLASL